MCPGVGCTWWERCSRRRNAAGGATTIQHPNGRCLGPLRCALWRPSSFARWSPCASRVSKRVACPLPVLLVSTASAGARRVRSHQPVRLFLPSPPPLGLRARAGAPSGGQRATCGVVAPFCVSPPISGPFGPILSLPGRRRLPRPRASLSRRFAASYCPLSVHSPPRLLPSRCLRARITFYTCL